MHELGVVFRIIKDLKDVAAENGLQKIESVTLSLGEVSSVIPYYLKDCWEWASEKDELVKGAKLRIETIPAITHCEACGHDYSTVESGKICPECGSKDTYLLQGNEFVIKEIEAFDADEC